MGFLHVQVYKLFHQNDAVGVCVCVCVVVEMFAKKTDSQGSPSCFESESPRMWSGNLHFNKFPWFLPCI